MQVVKNWWANKKIPNFYVKELSDAVETTNLDSKELEKYIIDYTTWE